MRIFVAGATGVLGIRVVPLLVADGHEVTGTTRSEAKEGMLRSLGAHAAVCDVYDSDRLREVVVASGADAIVHLLTDLPDDLTQIDDFTDANARIRREGTHNLLAAAAAAGVKRFLAESVAWRLPGDAGAAIDELERSVLDARGVVLRYGQFTGPGTYHPDEPPQPPTIDIDDAASRTVLALRQPSGIIELIDPDPDR